MEQTINIPVPGVITSTQFVDPAVSRVKFERELALFKSIEDTNRERGIILLQAEFPDIILAFTAYKVRPVTVVFTVKVNFTNYDVEPPSVQFIDALTHELVRVEQLPTRLKRKVPVVVQVPAGDGQTTTVPGEADQALIQFHEPHNIPFLCLAGIREYHAHPAHSNDPWLNHRGKSEGTLGFLIEQLLTYGTNPITGMIPQAVSVHPIGPSSMNVQFSGITFLQSEVPR
ncbi:MAG: hypothetical protein BGO70_01225 [Bacteroidetes bacterium 43-93]|mgnify:CR=1 FL=1|uniref:putative metal-binding protein n=1 Tax=uncultured Dysgonomonas sp. TaxID=206096 RepID=UPI000928FD53|nr:putative metal-binding protein [uncultured Dysgonomonas sp.]MBN9483102.1 hypothetical protein [Bacteroidota bacterium]OJW96333.1 MAG: hypothetical protein BGO70_01225 [Bacteroidetes bacterium 43-93]